MPQCFKQKSALLIEEIDCLCGCGNKLKKYDSRGRERKYVFGHSNKGKNNGMWKEYSILTYGGIHYRMKLLLPKPELCQICNKVSPQDLANISGKYLCDIKDWQWLCRKCHMLSDNRIYNLKQYMESK